RGFLEPRGLESLRAKLRQLPPDQQYAVSGSLAAQPYASYAEPRLALLYADDPPGLASTLGLRPVDTGANVIVVSPRSPVVFERTPIGRTPQSSLRARQWRTCATGPGATPPKATTYWTGWRRTPMSGDANLIVEARTALLDALAALEEHRDSVILVGAQAVYLHAGQVSFAIAEVTKDSDLAIDARTLGDNPRIEEAMTDAGFALNPTSNQPGAWVSTRGIPVDLMVPEHVAGPRGRRAAKIPPHGKQVARRAIGLEAALVDYAPMVVKSLADDGRSAIVNVAGPAALLVAKLHKLGERTGQPSRLNDKDAHDSYRLLVAITTFDLAAAIRRLLGPDISRDVTLAALDCLDELFARGPESLGSVMAGRAEEGVGRPDTVAAAVSVLAQDLLTELADDQS